MGAQAATPGEQLRRLVFGYRISQAIGVAAELGMADDHLHIDIGYATLAPRGASERTDGSCGGIAAR